jgi:hypothetical protein
MNLIAAQLGQEYPVESRAIRLSRGIELDPDDRAGAARFLGVLIVVVGVV